MTLIMFYLHLMDLQVILSAFLRAVMRLNLGVFQGNLMALKYYLFRQALLSYGSHELLFAWLFVFFTCIYYCDKGIPIEGMLEHANRSLKVSPCSRHEEHFCFICKLSFGHVLK